jgi:hypothetical protein
MRQLSTMQRVRRGALVAVLALIGALVLTGCRSEPGIAAYVGSEKITIDQVEAMVDAVDKVNAGRTADVQPGPVPISRQLVLALMVYGDLAHQLVSDRSLTPNPQFVDVVARGYGIPPAHPYAQLLGNYLDSIDILGKNAGTAAPSRDQILRYYRTGVDAQMFPPGLSDDNVVAQGSQAATIVGFLNAQTMLDDWAKKRHLTVNPRYTPLAMPVLLLDSQRGVVTGVPFGQTGESIVTDASEGGS